MSSRVLVVGGGIGGLVLARALALRGVAVELIERSPQLRALGAGISLGANAVRALGSIGLGEAIAARGRRLAAAAITDAHGRPLSATDFAELEPKYGPAYAIDRGALHEALAAGLTATGPVTIRCGTSVQALAEGEGEVIAETSDGRRAAYRAVIGADGLRSTVRALTFGERAPSYAGYTCWRWVGPVPGGLDASVEMWGRGLRVGLVPLMGEQVYAFLVANAPRGSFEDPSTSRVGHVRRLFAGFGGDAPRVLAALGGDEAPLLHHDIEEIEQRPWCRGAIGLLGDAAHAMTPNFGQGAAMAIEDAIVLARELVAHDAAPAALRAYEARRRARVEAIHRGARRFGAIAQWQSPVAAWMRDLAIRSMPQASARRTLESIVSYVA